MITLRLPGYAYLQGAVKTEFSGILPDLVRSIAVLIVRRHKIMVLTFGSSYGSWPLLLTAERTVPSICSDAILMPRFLSTS